MSILDNFFQSRLKIMFEVIKWLLLVVLMCIAAKTSNDLDDMTKDVLHMNITCFVVVVNFFLIIGTGLTFAFTLVSNFPQWLSNVMTAVIIVEFVYMLFIYGKVIPGYLSSGEVVPKTKDTIKID